MTLVEIMVALVILLVGVLGAVTMINGANAATSQTKAREGATHLGRQILEVARSVPYRNLTAAAIETELATRAGLADSKPSVAGYQITSRKFTYTVSITACSLDDPKDRVGPHDVAVTFCADTDVMPAGTPASEPRDRNPDDFRRVAVVLSWNARPGLATATTRQTTILTNPVGGLGPSVTKLEPKSPLSNPIIGAEVLLASFDVETDLPAAQVNWSINGSVQGAATGSNKNWSFNWPLVKADGSLNFFDGTYVVRAEAFDDEGRSGTPKSYTMVVNRIPPLAPVNVEGGRNLNGNRVDVEWQASPEPDVVGYRVYRSTVLPTPTALGTRVVCFGTSAGDAFQTGTSCLDESAPAPVTVLGIPVNTLYYTVVALDRTSTGALREGLLTTSAQIVEGNTAPTQPTGLTACTGGAPDCNDMDGQPAPSGTTVLTWNASSDANGIKFYRVYRNGTTYDKRYDRIYPTSGKPLVFIDRKNDGAPHEYRITAVDNRYGESAPSAAVSR